MSLLLSHNSALERLRAVPPIADASIVVAEPASLQSFAPAQGQLRTLRPEDFGVRQLPLHLMVPNSVRPSEGGYVRKHRSGIEQLPAGLIRWMGEDRYVSGPELCFIQMSTCISTLGAVVLGHELCGTYSQFSAMASGFYDRPALTSVERIQDVASQLSGFHGIGKTSKALRWVRDGSASPMETVVSCMLHLPSQVGGFGFEAPALNYEVRLSKEERAIAGRQVVRVDTAYPAVLTGLEFDGKEYHRDAESDRRRREALAHHGWKIYVINVDEAISYHKLREKVALMGKVPRQRHANAAGSREGEGLLGRLLNATRFGLGVEPLAFTVPVPRGRIRMHL